MGKEETHIYKITVSGMGRTEFYEFDVPVPEMDVKDMWINHGIQKYGMGIMAIKDRVEVEKIKGHSVPEEIKDGRQLI